MTKAMPYALGDTITIECTPREGGPPITADVPIIRITEMNDQRWRLGCERPGVGGDCTEVEVISATDGALLPELVSR